MRDVVADTCNLMDERFNLTQHPVDADGELVEWVIAPAGRQALAQIACHDALDSSVDIREPAKSPQAQHHADGDRDRERRQQAEPKGPPDDFRDLRDLIDVAPDYEDFTAWQWLHCEPHLLHLTLASVDPNDHDAGRNIGGKAARRAFDVAGDTMTVGTEQARNLDVTGILAQSIVDLCQPLLRGIGCEDAQLVG